MKPTRIRDGCHSKRHHVRARTASATSESEPTASGNASPRPLHAHERRPHRVAPPRVVRVRHHQAEQIDPGRAAPPERRRQVGVAADDVIAERVEHRRQQHQHHDAAGGDQAHHLQRAGLRPQRQPRPDCDGEPRQHQDRQQQHRRVERVGADVDAEHLEGAAAAEGDGAGEAADRQHADVERPAQPGDPHDGHVDGALDADELHQQAEAGHQHAEDAVVGVRTGRPRHHRAEAEGVADLAGGAEAPHQQREDRQRRRRDEAEVADAARDQDRREREGGAGDPRLGLARGQVARQQVRGVAGERDVEEEDQVERRDQADQRDQGPGQDVGDGRVVVEAEIGGGGVGRAREDRRRVEGQPALLQLVLEDPRVPHVDAGVTGRRRGERVVEMAHEGPRRDDREHEEPHEDGGVPPHATGHMAELREGDPSTAVMKRR